MGFIEETGAAQHQRDARITTIYEGTTGIQANDLVGRKLKRDGGATTQRLLRRMSDDAVAIADSDDVILHTVARALDRGVEALATATQALLDMEARQTAAGAVPYLQLCGTVMGGWLMARAARAATRKSDSDVADGRLLDAKRITAQHDALHVLPQAEALRDEVLYGAVSTLGLADDPF